MARRVSLSQSVKQPEKREYFNKTYSLKNVTGMKKPGDEAFVILLRPESYLFETEYHTVKEKIRGQVGFKGMYDAKITCKRYDAEGNRAEELPLCCQLADKLFKEAKEVARKEAISLGKDPDIKENLKISSPITFTAIQIYAPLIVLGTTDVDGKPSVSKLAIKNGRRLFTYLDMNKKSYISEIYDKLKTQLVNSGEIDSELSEEEMAEVMLEKFQTHIIKITAIPSKSPRIPYNRDYSFIPFTNKNIGSKSGEYEAIVNYKKDVDLENDAAKFLSLFEVEVDNFVKEWTDEELSKYLVEDAQRDKNIDSFKKAEQKAEQEAPKEEVEEIEEIVELPPAQTVVQKSDINITEEDITFDSIDDDFVDEDDFGDN